MSFTPNKNLQMPATGSFNNAWGPPINLNFAEIDTSFGGITTINVTGVTPGTIALTLAQYTPPNIVFTGTLAGNLIYQLPTGVGGLWSVLNNTTGSFSITINSAGGGDSVSLAPALRAFILCDGTNVDLADTQAAAGALAAAETFATTAANTAQSNAETFATSAANTAQSNAIATAANASNLSSGTVPAALLPPIFSAPSVTIQADPGGTPSGGAFGDVVLYF
jgi:hypothetical protein